MISFDTMRRVIISLRIMIIIYDAEIGRGYLSLEMDNTHGEDLSPYLS